MVEIVKPKLFFEYDRLENINLNNSNFNGNTYMATACKATLREMRRNLGARKEDEITGPDLVISLPFRCEVDIVEYGVQGHEQLYYIFSMTFFSTEKTEEEEK